MILDWNHNNSRDREIMKTNFDGNQLAMMRTNLAETRTTLAEERTILAWHRSGVCFMGFAILWTKHLSKVEKEIFAEETWLLIILVNIAMIMALGCFVSALLISMKQKNDILQEFDPQELSGANESMQSQVKLFSIMGIVLCVIGLLYIGLWVWKCCKKHQAYYALN